ncbi:hypothetical protein AOQ88_00140 [Candidatus Riesia sp. GBBU]|nr:hypothetical protein AOQ88_00140 [Candidatus Riesia sp. GBBU]
MKDSFLLIDGSFYLYRSYYTFQNLSNVFSEPIGAIHGFIRTLYNFVMKYSLVNIIVIFDAPGKNFRTKIYKQYKSNRKPMPKDLIKQINPIFDVIDSIGFPIVQVSGVEADDVIGTLVTKNTDNINSPILISTIDKDMIQLINNRVFLLHPSEKKILKSEDVVSKYGFLPNLMIDYLSLAGDSSDNIPGVPGIGKKTASILIEKIGDLKTIYRKLSKIKELKFRGSNSLYSKIVQYKKLAFLSYKLATIQTNLDLNFSIHSLKKRRTNSKKLKEFFIRYKLKSLFESFNKKLLFYF